MYIPSRGHSHSVVGQPNTVSFFGKAAENSYPEVFPIAATDSSVFSKVSL